MNITVNHIQQINPFQDTVVTIYQNSTQFSDAFSVAVEKGETTLRYEDLLPSMNHASAFVTLDSAGGEVISQSIETNRFSYPQFLKEQLNQKITLINDYDEEISGILLAQNESSYTLFMDEDGGQLVTIPKKEISMLKIPGLKEAISTKPVLKATYQTNNEHEDIVGKVIYLAKELAWSPNYRLIINETDSKIEGKWISEAQITNLSNRTFKDLMVRVVAGKLNEVTSKMAPVPCHAEMRMMCKAGANQAIDVATLEDWQDLKAFIIAQKVNLLPKEMFSARLYNPIEVDVEKTYTLHSYEHQSGFRRPNACYNIPNNALNGLNQPMPAGSVQVYQQQDSALNFMGAHTLSQTPKGEDIKVITGENYDLGVKRTTETKVIRNITGKVVAHEVSVSFEITNSSDQDQSIMLHEHLNQAKLLNKANLLPWIQPGDQETVFKVDVAKNTTSQEPTLFSYTYRKEMQY